MAKNTSSKEIGASFVQAIGDALGITRKEPTGGKRAYKSITSDKLKQIFTKDREQLEGKQKEFYDLIVDRIAQARMDSLKDWRVYGAIDEAWNVPFSQITPTIIRKIISSAKNPEDVRQQLKIWGLSEETLFTITVNDKKEKEYILNTDTFFRVFVPIVKAYVTARAGKIFNDLDNDPFFVYQPVHTTEAFELIGEILTNLIGRQMVENCGLKAVVKSAILHAIKYGWCITFPAEAWYYEEDFDDEGKTYTKKEGLRYNIPHPTRCAFDKTYRPATINSDTGCEWACYWDIMKYGSITREPYYNTDKVTYGKNWFDPQISHGYFQEMYPCVISPPDFVGGWTNNRQIESQRYTTNEKDKAVFVSNLFMKVIPKDWGLADVSTPVWIRFVVANDDTVIWAEPLPYCPLVYWSGDSDDGLSLNPSFALECLPWQDLVGNILMQHIITIRQNLMKVIRYDVRQVSESQIREIEAKHKDATACIWFPYDSMRQQAEGLNPAEMFQPINFQYQDTTQLISILNTVFNIMERALNMSAQELGTTAGHIQTAEEVRIINQNTSGRVQYIETFIYDAIAAMKRQLYEASLEFMDEEFAAEVNAVPLPKLDMLREALGFKFTWPPYRGKIVVSGDKRKLSVGGFLSSREGNTRLASPQTAQVMLQTIQAVVGQPELAQKIGVEWFVAMFNRIARMMGAPDDFEIKISPEAGTLAQMQMLAGQLQQMSQQIAQGAAQMAAQQTAPAIQQQSAAISQIAAKVGEIEKALGALAQQNNQIDQAQAEQINQIAQAVKNLGTIITAASNAPASPPEAPMVQMPMPPQ